MSKTFNGNLRKAMGLCQQVAELSEKGLSECNDDSCTMLWGKMKNDMENCLNLIETEIEGHKNKSKWD